MSVDKHYNLHGLYEQEMLNKYMIVRNSVLCNTVFDHVISSYSCKRDELALGDK